MRQIAQGICANSHGEHKLSDVQLAVALEPESITRVDAAKAQNRDESTGHAALMRRMILVQASC